MPNKKLTEVVCTQKNRFIETALLNSQTYVNNDVYENINNCKLKNFVYQNQ